MPNWSRNRITFYENYELEGTGFYNQDGDKDKDYRIKDIYDKFLSDVLTEKEGKKYYNLMEVMPCPEILTKVHATSPPYLVSDRETGEFVMQSVFDMVKEDRNLFHDTNTHPKYEKVEIVEGTTIHRFLMEEYGVLTWYDWNVQNWGTKWGTHLEEDGIEVDQYNLRFWCETAWSPPNELLQFIANKYKVNVECFYEIEGYGDDGVGKDTFEPELEDIEV